MDDTAKYLIHADITADGVVERSDVVGAVFGQTEGLLGDDLDLRDLQQTSKVGRIDVSVRSKNGISHGTITIASSLDKVETAILAAALETIGRVGPCRSTVSVGSIEDVRAAKRREVVDRAKELVSTAFDEDVMTSEKILEEVRQSVRVERITEYEGVPAGPRVADSDAIVVVEGRSDVLTLLQFGVKNAIAVEGTNVPDAVADLTSRRNVTAFLDGDRGGDLILKELAQVGEVDYVAFAPAGRSVEDLERHEVMTALREKVPFDTLSDVESHESATGDVAATDGSTHPAPETSSVAGAATAPAAEPAESVARPTDPATEPTESTVDEVAEDRTVEDEVAEDETAEDENDSPTLREHVTEVIEGRTDSVRLLDANSQALAEMAADDAFDALDDADPVPSTVILDGQLDQRLLDVATQRGIERIVTREQGQFAKKPTGIRVTLADEMATSG